jgi:GNAT superfamily N-acetyltransferase
MEIRDAVIDDAAAACDVLRRSIAELCTADHGNYPAILARDTGENYVSPDARFRGVSRAMLAALEARAMERGNARCTLVSTETARRLYLSAGYTEDGPGQRKQGSAGSFPMSKPLAPPGV